MSERQDLRSQLLAAIKTAFNRPKWSASERLADQLMPTVRQAQANAWHRGWAAGQIDASSVGFKARHNPYLGGRHAGIIPIAGHGSQYMYSWDAKHPAHMIRPQYAQTEPYPEPK